MSRMFNMFCTHKYQVVLIKDNFYGKASLSECVKCSKQKVDIIGWPDMGLPSKTKVSHFEIFK